MAKDTLVMSWKDIAGYEGLYQAHPDGMIKSVKRTVTHKNGNVHIYPEVILKQRMDKYGYYRVVLSKNGVQKTYSTHRLIAMTFLDNPHNLPSINHRNEQKTDNRICNLEWCDVLYNNRYSKNWLKANEGVKKKCGKPVMQFTKDGELVNEYCSVGEASRQTGTNKGNIISCCKGKYGSAGDFIWKYKE